MRDLTHLSEAINGVCISKASWKDLNQVWELEKKCFSKQDAWPYLDLLAALSFPGLVRYKACDGQNLVGFVGAEVKEGLGWITTIEVDPAYCGKGIGRALLGQAEAALQKEQVRLITRQSNLHAIHLYEGAGYQAIGVWPAYYVGGEDGLVFEKSLYLP
ncbi:MAG: N-acetyltransferase [Anaerolineaceae bacterium]|nr:N-acetyltransferase [Anaerolineaceae bacterium]